MASRTRFLVVVGATLAAASVVLALALPAPAATSVALPTSVEAWYQTGALATAPARPPASPVAPPPANPYGAGTLHVGVRAGVEDARTYLRFDVSSLPPGATVTGGRLVLPVDPGHGTAAPETARIDACLAPDPGPDVEGAFSPPPSADCTSSAPARYEPGQPARFVVDLAALGVSDLAATGFALVPAGAARSANATWHVSFLRRAAAPTAAAAIRAELDVDLPGTVAPVTAAGPGSVGSASAPPAAGDAEVFFDDRPSFEDVPAARLLPSAPLGPAPLLGPRLAVPATVAAPVAPAGGFRYPAVLALPLVAAILIALVGHGLTAPPRLVRLDETD